MIRVYHASRIMRSCVSRIAYHVHHASRMSRIVNPCAHCKNPRISQQLRFRFPRSSTRAYIATDVMVDGESVIKIDVDAGEDRGTAVLALLLRKLTMVMIEAADVPGGLPGG